MDETAIVALIVAFVSVMALVVIRLNGREDAWDESADGDWPHLPPEAVGTYEATTGRGAIGSRLVVIDHVRTHDKKGPSA